MDKKRIVFVLALAFVLLLGGAYTLYGRLGQGLEHNQLTVESPQEPGGQRTGGREWRGRRVCGARTGAGAGLHRL